ncbi:MAG: isoleucine--tRNA ligase, partial [Candidatus Kerfeldbacteria bacterium]|nr:isoleucine--tRNA ligase [Candidatus Kerfeldbacteria bacterium]
MAEQRRAPFDFPGMEEEILRVWKEQGIFQQTLGKPAPKGSFVFYEGPPYANGQPGVHHMLSRAYKDAVVRYRTMRGYRVQRRAGWDTHGLPVEMYVEKLLGVRSKREIEETIGVQRFVDECRKNVFLLKAEWEAFTERMGYWLDFDDAYVTLTPQYIESCWWIFAEIAKRGLLYQDFKVVPLCTRCGTVLSSHEMAQGYKQVTDRSVYVKFKMQNEKGKSGDADNTFILAWTTTPWTLPGNVALAVGENIRYLKTAANARGERYIVAEDLAEKVLGTELSSEGERIRGADLVGKKYRPLFDFLDLGKVTSKAHAYEIVPGGFVSTEDGTGVVHTAVMYGEDDFQLGKEFDLPKRHTVNPDGTFNDLVQPWTGKYVKDRATEDAIVAYLREHGKLLTTEDTVHDYPHCWRCDTPLLYYAKDSWFFRTTAVKQELLAANETINWIPSYLKHGRFGEWLTNVVDWAISRERYWGVPLPIWRCDKNHQRILGSFDELRKNATKPLPDGFDPHRPGIDAVELQCADCSGTMRRVPDVADVWFDSGSMPLSQWHYPFEHRALIEDGKQYPADFIAEGIDQTRGWFYTLLAVATLLGRPAPYRNVISLGLVNDAEGKKMSKRLGNLILPKDLFPRFGSDAVRWYLYTVSQAGDFKNFDTNGVDAVVKKVSLILLNVLSFHNLYTEGGTKGAKHQRSTHVLDRWIHAELASLTSSVTDALDRFEIFEATRLLQGFIDILSTWYVRRSRDRFKSDDADTRAQAVHTLHEVLLSVS